MENISQTALILNVSKDAMLEYEKNIPIMLQKVNEIMIHANTQQDLIQNNTIDVMITNHKNHASFMVNVFKLNDYKLLEYTIGWVISSYISRGFKEEYFKCVLDVWMEVIKETMNKSHSKEILAVYSFMLDLVNNYDKYAKSKLEIVSYPFGEGWEQKKDEFTQHLLKGDIAGALNTAKNIIMETKSLKEFYLKVVTYSMYDIGKQWENGMISVAQEHLATSMVMRIMSTLYMINVDVSSTKGKAIVTAAPNEYHEVGARIAADILELDGWDIIYYGANTPQDDLIKAIKTIKPVFVGMSVTMVYNIDKVIETIQKIRAIPEIANTKIMVGGYALQMHIDNFNKIGADKIIFDSEETTEIARTWWNESKNDY